MLFRSRTGRHYGVTPGLSIRVDGREVAHRDTLGPLDIPAIPALTEPVRDAGLVTVNYAINNDGDYFPRLIASHTGPNTSISKVHDGNAWFHLHPPNRWTCEGSSNDRDTLVLDLGQPRRVHTMKVYLLDDRDEPGGTIRGQIGRAHV